MYKKIFPKDIYFVNHCLPDSNFLEPEKQLDSMSGNIGNTYIMYCISKILFGYVVNVNEIDGISNLFNTDLENIDTDYINKNYKYLIINMQDQLRRDISYYSNTDLIFKNVNNFLNKINIEIICFGLGSNCFDIKNFNNIIDELHDSQIKFIKIISNKCKNFSIRGKYTKLIMDKLNIQNYSMVGCPTFFMNSKKIIKKNIEKIVIAGTLPYINQNTGNLNIFDCEIPKNIELFYFCQDIYERDIIEKQQINKINIVFLSDLEEINFFFKDKDLTLGTRVHASIISLNNNCLAICGNGDSRAKEMCELFKIPHINDYPNKNIYEIVDEIDIKLIEDNYICLKKNHDDFLDKIIKDNDSFDY